MSVKKAAINGIFALSRCMLINKFVRFVRIKVENAESCVRSLKFLKLLKKLTN